MIKATGAASILRFGASATYPGLGADRAAVIGASIAPVDADRAFLEEIFIRMRSELLAYIRAHCSATADAEDILHDMFYRTLRQTELAKIRINPKAYLYQIAINLMRDRFRSGRVSQRHLCADEFAYENAADTAQLPDQVVAYRSAVETFSEAVDKMGALQRTVFILARVDQVPYRQIAVRMQISLRSVERYVSDALTYLRAELAE